MSKPTIEQKWHEQSEDAKTEVEKLPYGKQREALERKAVSLRLHPKSPGGFHRQS
jgi:hypothetical protein